MVESWEAGAGGWPESGISATMWATCRQYCTVSVLQCLRFRPGKQMENRTVTPFCHASGDLCRGAPIHGLILSQLLTVAVPGMVISVGSEVRPLDLDLCLATYETHDLGQITQLLWV